mgnify:CR=1 FL=1
MGWAIHTGQNSLLQDENGMKVVVSGSSQIATNISGSFTSVSASIAADVASNLANRRSNTTSSGSFTRLSSSVATDIASNLSSITANSSSAAADIAANLVSITNGGAIPDTFEYQVVLDPEDLVVGSLNEDFALDAFGLNLCTAQKLFLIRV